MTEENEEKSMKYRIPKLVKEMKKKKEKQIQIH